jgi:hypothetical protein
MAKHNIDGLLKKALGRIHVALLAEHRVNQIAITIDGSIERAPFPFFDVDRGFINVPGDSCLSTSFCPQRVPF